MIRVYEPHLLETDIEHAADAIRRGVISGTVAGDYIGRFEELVAAQCGVQHGVATTSGTTALTLAVAACGIGPGDEVIVPSCTNMATAFAPLYLGATPVFVDSEPTTWNIDVTRIRERMTDKTRAIIPVHLYGHPADMDPIMALAAECGAVVIEDAAEAQGATYKTRPVGSLGHVACLSFYANKVVTTGEGGMLVTNDDVIAERARRLKNLAYSTTERLMHDEIGFNFRLTNLQAAVGVAQMERFESILVRKKQIAQAYGERLRRRAGLTLPPETPWATNIYWMYAILLRNGGPGARRVHEALYARGIETRRFFYPLHRQPVIRSKGLGGGDLPVSDDLWERGLYLPSGLALTETQIDDVCEALLAVL